MSPLIGSGNQSGIHSDLRSKNKDRKRLFFALWPDDDLRHQLKKKLSPLLIGSAKNKTAKRVPTRNWHITLAFIGDVNSKTAASIQHQADKLEPMPAFTFELDIFGFFKRAQVAWLGCSNVPEALQQLFINLNTVLEPCGYTPDHLTYTPHLTLLRKARRSIQTDKSFHISWQVKEFVLVESSITSASNEYEVIRRWPLI